MQKCYFKVAHHTNDPCINQRNRKLDACKRHLRTSSHRHTLVAVVLPLKAVVAPAVAASQT